MFFYIHKNGQQYGPYSENDLLVGLQNGSFSYNDMCWREGMQNWQPLSVVYQPPNAVNAPPQYPPPSPIPVTSGLAVTSLISGLCIFILGPIAGIVAIITGHKAQSQISKSFGRVTGGGMALGGLILGYFSVLMIPMLALLIAIALPNFQRAKKRSQATRVLEDLRMIDGAIDQYAIETNKRGGDPATEDDLRPYLKHGTTLYNTFTDVFGQPYGPYVVDKIPKVSPKTYNALSDVADREFWSPFY